MKKVYKCPFCGSNVEDGEITAIKAYYTELCVDKLGELVYGDIIDSAIDVLNVERILTN